MDTKFPNKKTLAWQIQTRVYDSGLEEFARTYSEEGIESISFPMLGCQHGGLNWEDVRPIMERHLNRISKEVEIYVHLYRPDLLPFPDHRDHTIIKAQLTGELDYPVFEDFWQNVQPHFSKKHAEILWDLLKDGQYVRLDDLPESNQPINFAGGCVYVKQVKGDKFLIGHRSDRKQLSRANLVEEIPAQNWESVEQELGTMFAAYKVLGSRKQFILDDAQLAKVKKFATHQRNRYFAETLQNIPSIRCVLLSNDPQPTYHDRGLQMLPTQIKSRPTQRRLTL